MDGHVARQDEAGIDRIFVIGFPRSGTTLLLDFLKASGHFPVKGFGESHFFSYFYKSYGSLSKPANRQRFLEAIYASNWFRGTGLSRDELPPLSEAEQREYAPYFLAVMDTLALKQGFSRWIEKTPWHLLYINEIAAAIPNARFILIVRDPRDVVLSVSRLRDRGWQSGPFHTPVRMAAAWRWHMDKAARDLAKLNGRHVIVKFEDLVAHPETAADKLSDFLGLTIDASTISQNARGVLKRANSSFSSADAIGTSPVERWKAHTDKALIAKLDYAVGPSLTSWGYQPSNYQPHAALSGRLLARTARFIYDAAKNTRNLSFPLVRK